MHHAIGKHQGLKNEIIRLRAQLQNIQDDPEQLGEEPILPPFTPNPMPAGQSAIKDYSPFRPVARSPEGGQDVVLTHVLVVCVHCPVLSCAVLGAALSVVLCCPVLSCVLPCAALSVPQPLSRNISPVQKLRQEIQRLLWLGISKQDRHLMPHGTLKHGETLHERLLCGLNSLSGFQACTKSNWWLR